MITLRGKIPISIHPLFWLIAFFIGWMWTMSVPAAFLCVVVIVISVICHEMGHALTAIVFGQKTRIELAAFGGFTYREGRKLKLWEEFLVVLNGPVVGFMLFFIVHSLSLYWTPENPVLLVTLKFTIVANLFWTVVNLIPILPLDGGHMLSIALEAIFGFKGVKIAIIVGLVIAVAISILFFALGMFLAGALFLILTFESFRSLRYYKIFSEKDRDTKLQELVKAADTDFQEGRSDEALIKLDEVRKEVKEGILYTLATQQTARIFRQKGDYEKAYALLLPIQKSLNNEDLALFQFLAYMNGDYKKIIEVATNCYQENPSANTALINALAFAASSQSEPAVGWLECAVRDGLSSIQDAIHREEFDTIRKDPRFLHFVNTH